MNEKLYKTYVKEIRHRSEHEPEIRKKPEVWRKWFIDQHLQEVVEIAGQFYQKVPNEIALLDLIQAGNVGLIKAVDQYIKNGMKEGFNPSNEIQTQIEIFLDLENRQSAVKSWALWDVID